ncbi:hypothetical protein SpCBS45565_g04555 [Spizellomyces sp. 'palustris']|nr:hypothetical protein SpCBS45565_g04555 [Spizellomyces sp. 'palustris']
MPRVFKLLVLATLALSTRAVPTPIRRAIEFGVNLPADDLNYDVNLSNGLRLIQFSPNEPPRWVPETTVAGMTIEANGFMDVTYIWETAYKADFEQSFGPVQSAESGYTFVAGAAKSFAGNATTTAPVSAAAAGDVPTISQQTLVKSLFGKIDIQGMKSNVNTFSALPNRNFKSNDGTKSATWLFDRATELLGKAGTTQKVTHPFSQFSIIATIPGASKEKVILGSHQDSISKDGSAPGADDDASGSMTIMEVMRVLGGEVQNGFQPARTLEFHWYAGEEGGLLGSQLIAQDYKKRSENVIGMMQFDMTGFAKDPANRRLAVMTDFTDPGLVALTKNLMKEYSTTPIVDGRCGFACSDHASWTRAGFKAVLPAEGILEDITPFIHTGQDTVDKLNWDHIQDFTQLGLSFMVEMAGGSPADAGNGTAATEGSTAAPTAATPPQAPKQNGGATTPGATPDTKTENRGTQTATPNGGIARTPGTDTAAPTDAGQVAGALLDMFKQIQTRIGTVVSTLG